MIVGAFCLHNRDSDIYAMYVTTFKDCTKKKKK